MCELPSCCVWTRTTGPWRSCANRSLKTWPRLATASRRRFAWKRRSFRVTTWPLRKWPLARNSGGRGVILARFSMSKWHEYDPATGMNEINVANETDFLTVHKYQDVTAVLDNCAEVR